jgi:plastocyanin
VVREMSRRSLMAFVCGILALVSGCGSSHTGSLSATGDTASAPATTDTPPASASEDPSTSAPRSGIKVGTTPKFASPSPSAPVQNGVVQIAYRDIAIAPDTVRVKLGSTIRWTNYGSTQANVTSVSGPLRFASKNFGEDGTFEIKATKPGVIHYECTLYPATMNGTIEVVI